MSNEIVRYEARDGSEVQLTFDKVKQFLVQGKPELVTPQEVIFFMGICKARGLNPFAKDCYLIKYSSDPAAIVISIDYFRSRAKAQPDCQGWQSGVIVRNGKGDIRYSNGLVLEDEMILGGWFEALPKGWDKPFRWEVNLKPYIKTTKEGNTTAFWHPDKQAGMISKVAESQGLRKVWPAEFAKLYLKEEIDAGGAMDDMTDILAKSETKIEDLKARIKGKKEETKASESIPSENGDTKTVDSKLTDAQKKVPDLFLVAWKECKLPSVAALEDLDEAQKETLLRKINALADKA